MGMSWPSPFSLTRPFGHRLGSCVAGVTRGLRGGLPHHTRVWAWGKSVLRPGLQAWSCLTQILPTSGYATEDLVMFIQ